MKGTAITGFINKIVPPTRCNSDGGSSYDDTEVRELIQTNADAIEALETGKVDKVEGKGLSTNDYMTAERTKLAGIAAGAEVNVIETVKVNGTAITPTDKAVNILASSEPENNANKLITSKAVYDYLNILKIRINDALTEDYGISVYPYYSGSQKIYLDEEHTIDVLYDSNTLYCRAALTAFYNRAIVGDSIVLKKNGTPMKTVQITAKRSIPDGLVLSADLIDNSMTFGTGEYNLYIVYA